MSVLHAQLVKNSRTAVALILVRLATLPMEINVTLVTLTAKLVMVPRILSVSHATLE
jgi:hypothetical protein